MVRDSENVSPSPLLDGAEHAEKYGRPGESFDRESYLALPVGQRLLTPSEVALVERLKLGPPEPKDEKQRMLLDLMRDARTGNGGLDTWAHNWNPFTQQPVYEEVPYELEVAVLNHFRVAEIPQQLTALATALDAPPEVFADLEILAEIFSKNAPNIDVPEDISNMEEFTQLSFQALDAWGTLNDALENLRSGGL